MLRMWPTWRRNGELDAVEYGTNAASTSSSTTTQTAALAAKSLQGIEVPSLNTWPFAPRIQMWPRTNLKSEP